MERHSDRFSVLKLDLFSPRLTVITFSVPSGKQDEHVLEQVDDVDVDEYRAEDVLFRRQLDATAAHDQLQVEEQVEADQHGAQAGNDE